MAKYLITGANGLLGSEIAKNEYFKDSIALSHKEFDLTNIDMMEKIVKKLQMIKDSPHGLMMLDSQLAERVFNPAEDQ